MKTNRRFAGRILLITTGWVTSAGAQNTLPQSKPFVLRGAYTLNGKVDKSSGQAYSADAVDTSAILVKSGGMLTAMDPVISSSGATSSDDNSSFFGLNAAVLATQGSSVKITGGSIKTTGAGANGAFAFGAGSNVFLTRTHVDAAGDGSHGVMTTQGGAITLTDVEINTRGAHAAAVATDRGGGTIRVEGGKFNTTGEKSPAIYSTGTIKVNHATMTATGAEAAVIEGRNSIVLTDTSLTAGAARGVMIYQSFSGDAHGTGGMFAMKGGSLSAAAGPLFYVTNTTATILVTGVNLNAASGTLIDASPGDWGRSGYNGGTVTFTADHEQLKGDLTAGTASAITARLQNQTTLSGAIKGGSLTLDSSSTWTVTGDSTITGLNDAAGISMNSIRNIVGGGHDVHYDPMLRGNASLGGRTYSLASGGHLIPTRSNSRGNGPDDSNTQNGFGARGGMGGRR